MTATNFWRFRLSAEGTLTLCQVKADNMDEYKKHYNMRETSDIKIVVDKLCEDILAEGSVITELFNIYFDKSIKNEMLKAVTDEIATHDGIQFIKCRDCKKVFAMSDDDRKWYTSHDLSIPKRCSACRKRRKAESKKKTEDAAE
jgi:hypothetical protein